MFQESQWLRWIAHSGKVHVLTRCELRSYRQRNTILCRKHDRELGTGFQSLAIPLWARALTTNPFCFPNFDSMFYQALESRDTMLDITTDIIQGR